MTQAAIECDTDIDHSEGQLPDNKAPTRFSVFKSVRAKFSESLHPLWPRYRLEVPDGQTKRSFPVGKPSFRAEGLVGRGTRGYVALYYDTAEFVWLKDVWRTQNLMVEQEGSIFAQLNDANIPHPVDSPSDTVCAAASSNLKRKRDDDDCEGDPDLPLPKRLKPDPRSDCPFRLSRHYRLVVKEVALPSNKFKCGKQLVSIIKDCVLAHWKAYTDTKILHRDISGGNIPIVSAFVESKTRDRYGWAIEWTGLLADWEMSKPLSSGDSLTPSQLLAERPVSAREGFVMSGLNPKLSRYATSWKSFLYVLIYSARYLRSNYDDNAIAHFIDSFYDFIHVINDTYSCGRAKVEAIQHGDLNGWYSELSFNSRIDTLLKTILSWLQAHYHVTKYECAQNEEAKKKEN
ncbi:hypothetical protein C8Q74DRAFT_1443901 [Fomes fomentarius]|nr:hypothetical protein C8Q74DRAFT_1443901 [Fomes fomentarius]